MSEIGPIYQAPTLLTQKQIKRTQDSSLLYERKLAEYAFNPRTKNYDVQNVVRLNNNQLRYALQQFHWHQRAEYVIEGQPRHQMELHFVFQDPETDSILVLAFLFRIAAESSPLVTEIILEGL